MRPLSLAMDMLILLMIMVVSAVRTSTAGRGTTNGTVDQYIELGTEGTLQCPFESHFFALFWYDTVEHTLVDPILKYQNGRKSGTGFENGDYDVDPNGYLVIPEVKLSHEGVFTCLYFETQNDDPVALSVNLIVTVSPFPTRPVIDQCDENVCFRKLEYSSKVTCFVRNVRPVVEIDWYIRTHEGDELVMDQTYSINSNPNGTFSTSSEITVSHELSLTLTLFVCKSKTSMDVKNFTETTLLIEHGTPSKPTYLKSVYFERFSTMILACDDDKDLLYLVWRRHSRDVHGEYIMVIFTERKYRTIQTDLFEVDETGSLIVYNVDIEQEDRYSCFYSDGITDNITYYDVSVYVLPDPPYPVVDGCTNDQYCVIDVTREGSLSCALFGVRPEVDLEMRTILQSDSRKIHFFEKQVKLKTIDDKFDIILTTRYKIEEPSLVRLTLECVTGNGYTALLQLSSTFDLLLVDDVTQSISVAGSNVSTRIPSKKNRISITVVVIIIVVCLVCLVISVYICKGGRGKRKQSKETSVTYEKDELKSMLPDVVSDGKYEANRETLKSELQCAYKPMYNSVCPMPFLQETVFGVEEIYVDGGIEHYVTGKLGHKTWAPLSSYRDILREDIRWSSVRVVEGGPGYGKSILALLLAHDWCEGISPLIDMDIFIFLQFRQLAMTESLFSAIKLLLLPDDSQLTNMDIEDVIKRSSVLLLLDGYDELKFSERPEYIKKILGMQILQKLQVIVTTRTFCFPKEVKASSTRIRLTGFNDVTREKYLSKVLVHDNLNATEVIKQSLDDNPILRDFFQVPFIFVMFAHIAHETNAKLKFHSVTSFFQYMLTCFHSHQRNKYKNERDQIASKDFERDHSKLDSLALENILNGRMEGQWNKQDIISKLGERFFEQYLKTGILVEKMVMSYCHKPEIASSSPVQRDFMVRFFHELFSEWFAAFALAEKVKNTPDENIGQTLRKLNPLKFQYLYRFACGVNEYAAGKLINYLGRIRDGQEFAILCLLEKSGKIEDIKDIVEELCTETIYINLAASRLLQRSTIQLVDIASKAEIPVTCIHLEKCFHSVNPGKDGILLSSQLCVPNLTFVGELKITEMGREMTMHEATGLLEYVLNCHQLKRFSLECCMVPAELLEGSLLEEFRKSETSVLWNPIVTWYRLDSDGKWENEEDKKIMTTDEYQEVLAQFRESWSDMPWQKSRRSEKADN